MAFIDDFSKEVDAAVKLMVKTRNNALLQTLAKLAEPLTTEGILEGDPNDVGSPVWTGTYCYNHRISVNGEDVEYVAIKESAEVVADPINPTPSELVAREKPKLANTSLSDTVSIKNETPWAGDIETYGSPLIPEGAFFERAAQYFEALLDRDMAAIASVTVVA